MTVLQQMTTSTVISKMAVLLQVAGFALPADERIKRKIADLVDDGVLVSG